MIAVKVTYRVKDQYIDSNKEMIRHFLTDFQQLDSSAFLYSVFQGPEENTFIHLSQYKVKEIQQSLLNTSSFVRFQNQRDLNLASEPTIEILNPIGASKEVF